MKIISNLIVIVAFCTGTVGAAGMTTGRPEAGAAWLLGLGLAGIVVGGIWGRLLDRQFRGHARGHHETRDEFRRQLEGIRAIVVDLDERKAELTREEVTERLDQLFKSEYFDLTLRHEELMKLLGFAYYARIWDGVATAERLLARAWSIATDGHLEEALEELPAARAQLDQACDAME